MQSWLYHLVVVPRSRCIVLITSCKNVEEDEDMPTISARKLYYEPQDELLGYHKAALRAIRMLTSPTAQKLFY